MTRDERMSAKKIEVDEYTCDRCKRVKSLTPMPTVRFDIQPLGCRVMELCFACYRAVVRCIEGVDPDGTDPCIGVEWEKTMLVERAERLMT